MTGAELMAVVGFFLVVAGAGWGIWWRIEAKVERGQMHAVTKAEAATALTSLIQSQFSEFRVHVAETYVSKAGHREATEQVMDALHAVKSAIDGTNQRIDRMWESHGPPKRRNPQTP